MWLPKDERRLLSYYYQQISKVETNQAFEIKDLIKALKRKQVKPPKTKREIILETYNLLENVNNLLSSRGLITWENLDSNSISVARFCDHPTSQKLFEDTTVNLRIKLTIEGYDLGRKYNSWWDRSGLWFAENKDHWFWLIVSFLGGIICTLVVNWLSK
jgi:hypothetical protein